MKAEEARLRLQRLNALFAIAQGDDADLAKQLRCAIEIALDGVDGDYSEEAMRCTMETLRRLYTGSQGAAFAQVDLSESAWGPLWVGEAVANAMRSVAGYGDIVLVVSGLSDHVCPQKGRWSRACRADYDSMRVCVERTAARYMAKGARLRIFFI